MVVQSRYYTRQKGQGSYISVLESQRNAVSEPESTPSCGLTNRQASLAKHDLSGEGR